MKVTGWTILVAAFLAIGCGRDTDDTSNSGDSVGTDGTDATSFSDVIEADVTAILDVAMDAGRQDAGRQEDAGPVDVGAQDVGPTDAGPVDAGPVDTVDAGTDVPVPDVGPIDTVSEDAGTVDEFFWVRITDNPENSSLAVCLDVFASPGADIDAVLLYRGGQLLGHATAITGMLDTDPNMTGAPCQNDFDDLKDAEGAPDAEEEAGFTSLNGGYLIFRFDGNPEIEKGDFISVVELGTANVGVPESYRVDIGQTGDADGIWVPIGGLHVGEQDIEVSF
ncbi:MAG: hypothetical protein ACI9OJ_005209 [Myxococcota bacterium]|jgi:hypothetical protein